MNSDELKELWAAAGKGVSAERMRGLAAAAMERERRRRIGLLVYVFAMVALGTIGSAWPLVRKGIGLEEAWPAWLMLLTLWITAFSLLRILRAGPPAGERPIRVMLETLLRQAETRCREIQILLGLFAAVAPLAFIAIRQLEANGKMRAREAASAEMLFGTILLGFGGWFAFELLGRKLPEKRHLEGLVKEYRG